MSLASPLPAFVRLAQAFLGPRVDGSQSALITRSRKRALKRRAFNAVNLIGGEDWSAHLNQRPSTKFSVIFR